MNAPTNRLHLITSEAPAGTDLAATWLVINRLQGFDIATPLTFLEQLPVTALHIVDANKRDVAVVQKLTGLRHLILGDTTQPLDLSGLTQLRSLSVFWTKAMTLPPAGTPIEHLDLRHYKAPSKNLSDLPLYPSLHTLHLTHGNARTLAGLDRFPKLRHLSLNTMMRLTSVDDARRLQLDTLDIKSCAAIRERKPKPSPISAPTPDHDDAPAPNRNHDPEELGEG